MSHHETYRSHRRPRARWTTLDWAASVSISAFWHVLVLAVLALAWHPFQLPDLSRPVDLELLPPLTPPPMPNVNIELRPRQEEPAPPPKPQIAPQLRPATPEVPPQPPEQALPQPQPAPPETPPQPLEQVRPSEPALAKPIEAPRRAAVQVPRLQTQQAAPTIRPLPPEPVTVTRPNPAVAPPIEAPRAEAPRRAGPLDTSRAAPQLTQQAPSEAETLSTAPSVLTNSSVVQAPVEIHPRERTPIAPGGLTTQAAPPQITGPAPGGAPAASGETGPPAGGGRPGASRLPPGTLEGFKNLPLGGMRTDLGCENPDTYHLTAEERTACLDKFAKRAKQGPDLGLNIPARKQAEYDHDVACHKAYTLAAIPGSAEASRGTSIPGMGSGPTLKECGPGER